MKGIFKILTGALICAFTFGAVACNAKNGEKTPEVKNVALTAEVSDEQGKTQTPHTLSYDAPTDSKISVTVKRGSTTATADDFIYLESDRQMTFFTPADYTVTVTAAKDGLIGSGKTEITITQRQASEEEEAERQVTLSAGYGMSTEKYLRVEVGKEVELPYTLDGDAGQYAVTYSTDSQKVSASKGSGNTVKVMASEPNSYAVTVTCTKKGETSNRQSLVYKLYAVTSERYSPVFGDDPFDGMPDTLLTSVGYQLYFDATPAPDTVAAGTKREFTYRDVKFELVANNVTAASGGNNVELLNCAGDKDYPYVIVSNFDHNVAKGSFTLKMTVTDPASGESAAATRRFQVQPMKPTSGSDYAKVVQDYIASHSDFFKMSAMNFNNICSDARQNMTLTKTGVVFQRSNPDWPLQNDSRSSRTADFTHMDFDGGATDCRMEFKMTVVGTNGGAVWLGIGVRTGTFNGWCGFIDLYAVNGKMVAVASLSNTTGTVGAEEAVSVPAVAGSTAYYRLDRRMVDSVVTYTLSVRTADSEEYHTMLRFTADASASNGSAGAPVAAYQFSHRNAGGCYAIEDVTLINFN